MKEFEQIQLGFRWFADGTELRRTLFPKLAKCIGATPAFFDFTIEHRAVEQNELTLNLKMPFLWPNSQIAQIETEVKFLGFDGPDLSTLPTSQVQWIEFERLREDYIASISFANAPSWLFRFRETREVGFNELTMRSYRYQESRYSSLPPDSTIISSTG
jgi:hypothetical protein